MARESPILPSAAAAALRLRRGVSRSHRAPPAAQPKREGYLGYYRGSEWPTCRHAVKLTFFPISLAWILTTRSIPSRWIRRWPVTATNYRVPMNEEPALKTQVRALGGGSDLAYSLVEHGKRASIGLVAVGCALLVQAWSLTLAAESPFTPVVGGVRRVPVTSEAARRGYAQPSEGSAVHERIAPRTTLARTVLVGALVPLVVGVCLVALRREPLGEKLGGIFVVGAFGGLVGFVGLFLVVFIVNEAVYLMALALVSVLYLGRLLHRTRHRDFYEEAD